MIEVLPKRIQQFVNLYFSLLLNGKKVPCPYYINIRKLRMGLRVLIGKGTPEEIIQESLIYEKLRGVDFDKMSVSQIRKFMVKRHIGIDCSGFVVHILDHWLLSIGKKHIWKYIKFPKQSLYRKIATFLRPVENISADILTNDQNSSNIESLNNIKVGDLIRSKGLEDGFHIMLISKVRKEKAKLTEFEYIQATRFYDDQHGVRKGNVKITNPQGILSQQRWGDEYKGRNWTYEEICIDKEYSQVRRLKNVPLL